MKECVEGTKAIAHFLDPFPAAEKEPWSQLCTVDESCVVEALTHNKVVMAFRRKLEMDRALEDKFFGAFPRAEVFFNKMSAKFQKDSLAFRRIKDKFSEAGIEFMLIKSDGSFPYESDNIDVLIKPKMLRKVAKLLQSAGYSELSQVREPHKFLFRDMHAWETLPLHIHTRVEWEGTQFINSQDLWARHRLSGGHDGFSVPSPEDCILITAAHLFFENHEIKLADLFKIDSTIRNHDIDWDYAFDHVQRLHWDDALRLIILQLDYVCNQLYGRSMLQDALSRMEESKHDWSDLFARAREPFSSGVTPLRIPYTVAMFFFFRRVARERSLDFTEKFKHIMWVAYDVAKRKTG